MKKIEKTINGIKDKDEREKAELIYRWYTWKLTTEDMRQLLTRILAKPSSARNFSTYILYNIGEKMGKNNDTITEQAKNQKTETSQTKKEVMP